MVDIVSNLSGSYSLTLIFDLIVQLITVLFLTKSKNPPIITGVLFSLYANSVVAFILKYGMFNIYSSEKLLMLERNSLFHSCNFFKTSLTGYQSLKIKINVNHQI